MSTSEKGSETSGSENSNLQQDESANERSEGSSSNSSQCDTSGIESDNSDDSSDIESDSSDDSSQKTTEEVVNVLNEGLNEFSDTANCVDGSREHLEMMEHMLWNGENTIKQIAMTCDNLRKELSKK